MSLRKLAVTALSGMLLGTGCATTPQPPVAMEAVIGNNFGHLPMFVGVEKGLFKKHGIDLKLKVVNTGTDMVNAMTQREAPGCPCATPARRGPRAGPPSSISGCATAGFGWPFEMVLAAGRAGWRIVEVPVPYLAAGRAHEQGDGHGARHGARIPRPRAGDAVHLIVIARRRPRRGRVKTRLCPPCSLDCGLDQPRPRSLTRSIRFRSIAGVPAGRVRSTARQAPGCLKAYLRVSTAGDGLAARSPRPSNNIETALLIGMDTPQVASLG